jgi:hypothetical protein
MQEKIGQKKIAFCGLTYYILLLHIEGILENTKML